jgi:uncharacterized protein (UPF0332 family)
LPIDPQHLFEQAERLAAPLPGRPRRADLRRAISTAYYAIFHATLTAAADYSIGANKRSTGQYALAYRSVDHKWLRDLCKEVSKPVLAPKFVAYELAGGFCSVIAAFASAVVELQEKRHSADYDPLFRVTPSDAVLAISTARAALSRFQVATPDQQAALLSLLLFRPR